MTTAVTPSAGSPPSFLPVPDPTLLTTAQIVREIDHLRNLVEKDLAVRDQRFQGIDRATDLLNEQMTRVPTETDLKTGQLKELVQRDISAIYAILEEREKRFKESTALTASALDANARATRESIAKNETLANQSLASLAALIATLQSDVSDQRVTIQGLIKERAGAGTNSDRIFAIIAIIVAVISVAFAISRGV